MSTETVTMLLEILKKVWCSEETMNAVKADPALKTDESETQDKTEAPEMEDEKKWVAVVVTKEEKPEEESPMKALMKSMLKSKWL